MTCVVVDVETTCWDDLRHPHSEREIIEIGAVRLDDDYIEQAWFSQTVRPVRHFELGEFCTRLTGIAQAEVDAARGFAEVLADFVAWAGAGELGLCSWGVYGRCRLACDAEFRGVALSERFVTRRADIRRGFIRWRGIDHCGLLDACKLIREPFAGAHRRGLDDARNAVVVLGAWQRAHAQLRARAAVRDVS